MNRRLRALTGVVTIVLLIGAATTFAAAGWWLGVGVCAALALLRLVLWVRHVRADTLWADEED